MEQYNTGEYDCVSLLTLTVTLSIYGNYFCLSSLGSLPLSDFHFTVELSWVCCWCVVVLVVFQEKSNLEISWSSKEIA